MSPLRTSVAAIAASALLLFACGDDDDADGADAPEATDDADGGAGADDGGDDGGADGGTEPSDDVPDGVAATVDSTEISIEAFEGIFDEIAGSSAIAPQLEGDDGEAMTSALRTQLLSQLVVQEIVVQGAAEDYSIELTDDDLETTLDGFESEAGGSEAFDSQLEEAGLTRDAFVRLELPLAAVFQELESEFGDLAVDPDAPDEAPEGQAALQEWATSKFADAEVAVAAEYGTWVPETGEIQPPA